MIDIVTDLPEGYPGKNVQVHLRELSVGFRKVHVQRIFKKRFVH